MLGLKLNHVSKRGHRGLTRSIYHPHLTIYAADAGVMQLQMYKAESFFRLKEEGSIIAGDNFLTMCLKENMFKGISIGLLYRHIYAALGFNALNICSSVTKLLSELGKAPTYFDVTQWDQVLRLQRRNDLRFITRQAVLWIYRSKTFGNLLLNLLPIYLHQIFLWTTTRYFCRTCTGVRKMNLG